MNTSNSSTIYIRHPCVLSWWLIVFGAFLLSSCQNFPTSTVSLDPDSTTTYQGRIAFKDPDVSFVLIFSWLGSDSGFQLTLRDRLGFSGVRVQGNDSSTMIEHTNGKTEKNVDLDAWIEDNLGITIPFRNLWDCLDLNCQLIDDADQQEYDPHGRIETVSDSQWTFKFSYREADPDSTKLEQLEMYKGNTQIRIFFTKFEH